jgi:hypothetical protein
MFRNRYVPATFFSFLTFLALIIATSERTALSQGEVKWRTDFEQAWAEARHADKPLFVVFR